MASLRSGFLKPPALEECRDDPFQNRFWGVDQPAAVDVMKNGRKISYERAILQVKVGDQEVRLFRHPTLMMDEEEYAFIGEYDFLSSCSTQISYGESNPKYHLAKSIYESYLHQFTESLRPKKGKKG